MQNRIYDGVNLHCKKIPVKFTVKKTGVVVARTLP